MALTGKTISQLDYLQFPTNETVIPAEYAGDTYHINFSSVTFTEGTYSQFVSDADNGVLTPGRYYLMTDYQTCYDQPLFDSEGTPITTGNYKTGTTEPILLLAISTTGFSPTVYSTLYPQDKISYDIDWDLTEVTNSPAKGRITERIDDRNNRTDYDFRAVQFKRYHGYFSESLYQGTASLDSTSQPALVTGVGTSFDGNFSVGDTMGFFYPSTQSPIGCFKYYEVTSIVSATEMYVSGLTYSNISNAYYGRAYSLTNYSSPFPPNITGGTNDESAEYYTFNDGENDNTYIGNTLDSEFILSNNVFLGGPYSNNTFGDDCLNNTFTDPSNDNVVGSNFKNNIITNNFNRNFVESNFQNNIVECDMTNNQIGPFFEYNTLGDDDGQDFTANTIKGNFRNNFFTMEESDFQSNNIGWGFTSNVIKSGFYSNTISGRFETNYLPSNNFDVNIIEDFFQSNRIFSDFENNKIGGSFTDNNIYSSFDNNTIADNCFGNTFGDPNSIGTYSFRQNNIGVNFINNYFSGTTQGNTIGNGAEANNVDDNFSFNTIGDFFASNTIASDFGFGGGSYRGNIVGNGFVGNTIGEYCYDNTFGDECNSNTISDNFTNNRISFGMNNTIINDPVGLNGFRNNTITYGYFSQDLTTSGGGGGNPVFYVTIPTTVTLDYLDASGYVTFLSGGTIIAQNIIV